MTLTEEDQPCLAYPVVKFRGVEYLLITLPGLPGLGSLITQDAWLKGNPAFALLVGDEIWCKGRLLGHHADLEFTGEERAVKQPPEATQRVYDRVASRAPELLDLVPGVRALYGPMRES